MTVAGGSRATPGVLTRHIATILQTRVASLEMSQADLAAEMGISQTQVGRYLRAERVLNIEELALACEVLDLDLFNDVIKPAIG